MGVSVALLQYPLAHSLPVGDALDVSLEGLRLAGGSDLELHLQRSLLALAVSVVSSPVLSTSSREQRSLFTTIRDIQLPTYSGLLERRSTFPFGKMAGARLLQNESLPTAVPGTLGTARRAIIITSQGDGVRLQPSLYWTDDSWLLTRARSFLLGAGGMRKRKVHCEFFS